MSTLQHVAGFLRYYLTASNRHDLHSPFLYQLNEAVLRRDRIVNDNIAVENIRKSLLRDHTLIPVEDYGAGSLLGVLRDRKFSEIAKHSSKTPRYGRLLYRLVKYLKPENMLELGTAAGISALYQCTGYPQGKLYTLEGNRVLAERASKLLDPYNVEVIAGRFEDNLPTLLEKGLSWNYVFIDGNHRREPVLEYFRMVLPHLAQEAVVIVDDINWSDSMKLAWSELIADSRVQVSVDLYQLGLLFFRPGLSKQDFCVRY